MHAIEQLSDNIGRPNRLPHFSEAQPKAIPPARTARPSRLDVPKVISYVEARLHEPVTMGEMARQVNLSVFHFARMFKLATGHPPHAFLMLKRIEHAKELLTCTDLPLADIGHRVGYKTQSHFTSVFRRCVGLPPNAYRQKAAREAAPQ
jgi:AraC family transcriptional regulator